MSASPHRKENLNSASRAPELTRAQRSNLQRFTAWGYPVWRRVSLSLLAGENFPLEREAALFLGHCAPMPGEWWLDAGTSSGFYAGVLAGAGCRVLAADLSPAMLRGAARRNPDARIEPALLNLEQSGLPDHSFDGVAVGATLNETHDPARFLGELARMTRPGGQLWLMYLAHTGGPLQRALTRRGLGGLSFPDPAWVERHLPTCRRVHGLTVGAVRFERYLRQS